MDFEYDPAKHATNRIKHGIDFEDAKALWNDPWLLELSAAQTDEPRFLVVGRIGDKHWSAIYTERSGRIRLISVRRSRPKEVMLYESR